MTRFFIYLFPALLDLVLGAVFFVSVAKIVDTGAAPIMSTLILAIWAVFYMVFAQVAGWFVTPSNAAKLIIGACFLIGFTAMTYYFAPFGIFLYYFLIALIAIGAAFFFTPFQVFMKTVESDRPQGIALSTGMYTFAWSTGMGAGPFVAGLIKKYFTDFNYCHLINAGVAFLAAVGVFCLKHHAKEPQSALDVREHEEFIDYSRFPDFAWLSWLASGIGCLTVGIIRSYFQTTGNYYHVPEYNQGVVLAIVSIVQGLVGLCLCKSKYWMYKPIPVMLFGLCGILGLLFFAFGKTVSMFYFAAASYGIYSGAFFFYFVFHALVHPEKSGKYVAINESVVGATSILGALLAGFLGAKIALSSPYILSIILVVFALLTQIFNHTRLSVGKLIK